MKRAIQYIFASVAFACLAFSHVRAEPKVVSVTSTNEQKLGSSYYGLGTGVNISVRFDAAVDVTGQPIIELATSGSSNGIAFYNDGSGTTTLRFEYIIKRGQVATNLNYASINALQLNGGTIDGAGGGAPATLTLPALDAPGSLAKTTNINIATPPIVMSVTSTNGNWTYNEGAQINVRLVFSEQVRKSGTNIPRIELATAGASNAFAYYSSGSDSAELDFIYTVGPGQQTAALGYTGVNAFSIPNNSHIQGYETFGLSVDTTLPPDGSGSSLKDQKAIKIDTPAVVTNVTSSTPDGRYGMGSTITILAQFSESVVNAGTATLELGLGAMSNVYAYSFGPVSGTWLAFTYVVGNGQNSSRLSYVDATSLAGTLEKEFPSGTPDVLLGLPAPGQARSLGANRNIVIDTAGPEGNAFVPVRGAVGVASNAHLQIVFDEDVIKDTGNIKVYRYDDETEHASIAVASTNVVVAGSNVAIYFGPALESQTRYYVTIDGTAFRDDLTNYYAGIFHKDVWYFTAADFSGPYVTQVTSTTEDGSYTVGGEINVRVFFSENIKHTNLHGILLNTGGAGRNAVSQDAGPNYIDLLYTVQSGDNSSRLQYMNVNAFSNYPGAWIRDLSDNNADLTLPLLTSPDSLASNKAIVIDTIRPYIINVTSTNENRPYTTNSTISVSVQFNERVFAQTNTPTLQLDTGVIKRNAVYVGGSGTTNLWFEYVVHSGDSSTNLNYVSVNALSNSTDGVIRDTAGNLAVLDLPAVDSAQSLGGNKDIVIDTIPPRILNVTSTNSDGYYRAGSVLDVRLETSKPVTLTGGSPRLVLNSGPSAAATFVQLVDQTNLLFGYTVADGENSPHLDYVSASALNLMGATVRDAAGNYLITNLPAPGVAGSLGENKNFVIDTIAPTVSVVSDSTNPTNASPIVFIATFNEVVSNFNTAAIGLINASLVPSNFAGQVGSVFRFHVVPSGFGSEIVQTVTVELGAGAAQDLAGNSSLAAAPVSRIYDTLRPVAVMSSTAANPAEISPIPVNVLFNEPMSDFSAASIRVTNAAIVNFSGSGAIYSFDLLPYAPGVVRANIDDGVAHDMAGNPCYPSAAMVRTYIFPAAAWLEASDGLYFDRVALTWGEVSGAASYQVFRNLENEPYFAEKIGTATQASFSDTTAVAGMLYYYWVRPVNGFGGVGEFCEHDTGWRGLVAPTGLSATDGAYKDRIVVTWNSTPNASAYELYRSTSESFASASLRSVVAGTRYDDTQVGAGTYYYWVRAITIFGPTPFAGPESGWRFAFGDAVNNTLLDWRTGGSNVWFVQTRVTHDGVAAIQSGQIRDDEQSWVEAIAYGPGTLEFWWRVSSETNWDFVKFSVNDVLLAEISGKTEWERLAFNVPAGTNVLRWTYIKDHTRQDGDDAAWLDEVSYAEIPRNIVASDGVFSDRVRLSWHGSFVPGSSYRIYRSVTPTPAIAAPLADTTQSWFDDMTVVPGRVYYYWVQALTAHGGSSLGEYDKGHSRQVDYDFNADGRADLAVYDRKLDAWYITTITGSILAYGMPSGDSDMNPVTLVPADYDGDGAMDVGVYHEATGMWYVKTVAGGQAVVWGFAWGGPGCAPVPGDYDGDGLADVAVFVRATGEWYIWPWTGQWGIVSWGWNGAEPIPADYDGDGKTDLAVFDRQNGRWYARSLQGDVLVWDLHWGWNTATVLPADYDGDGKADFGVYDAATGYWYILCANNTLLAWAVPWGTSRMIPVPADYDGDGRADLAVYDPSTGSWYIWSWAGQAFIDLRWGYNSMMPVIRGR